MRNPFLGMLCSQNSNRNGGLMTKRWRLQLWKSSLSADLGGQTAVNGVRMSARSGECQLWPTGLKLWTGGRRTEEAIFWTDEGGGSRAVLLLWFFRPGAKYRSWERAASCAKAFWLSNDVRFIYLCLPVHIKAFGPTLTLAILHTWRSLLWGLNIRPVRWDVSFARSFSLPCTFCRKQQMTGSCTPRNSIINCVWCQSDTSACSDIIRQVWRADVFPSREQVSRCRCCSKIHRRLLHNGETLQDCFRWTFHYFAMKSPHQSHCTCSDAAG